MTYTLPEGFISDPTTAAVALLRRILTNGEKVSTPSPGVQSNTTFPMVRATYLYDESSERWERRSVFQVDVWAPSKAAAANIAGHIDATWETQRLVPVPGGIAAGCWVVVRPGPMTQTNESDLSRYFLQVGVILQGA